MTDPYDAWLEAESRDREEKFGALKRSQLAELRGQRASMSLLQRHHATALEAARLSTVPASSVERGRGGSERIGPHRQQTLDFADADRFIRAGVEMREAVLDEAHGFGAMRQVDQMFSEEKDTMILNEMVGWTPAEIEVFYRGKLGSAETIRRLRRAHKLRSKDGKPVEPRPEASA